jgi:hypothetical protein
VDALRHLRLEGKALDRLCPRLEGLPGVSRALCRGALGIDKVVELTRFATPSTESELIAWAQRVAPGAIRRRGDLEQRREAEREARDGTERSLTWELHSQGRRMALIADLPADEGSAVLAGLEAHAGNIPITSESDGDPQARLAAALVMACTSGGVGPAARPTIVIHTTERHGAAGEIEGGGIVPAATLGRLRCGGRVQMMTHTPEGDPLRVGRAGREPTLAMVRALRHRDRGCVFPGCGSRRFTQAHHIRWWSRGGRTDIENLVLLCHFHHTLVHEHGWRITRPPGGPVRWYRSDGTRYRAGPAPPRAPTPFTPQHEALAGFP